MGLFCLLWSRLCSALYPTEVHSSLCIADIPSSFQNMNLSVQHASRSFVSMHDGCFSGLFLFAYEHGQLTRAARFEMPRGPGFDSAESSLSLTSADAHMSHNVRRRTA
jgi:hypothetical protein